MSQDAGVAEWAVVQYHSAPEHEPNFNAKRATYEWTEDAARRTAKKWAEERPNMKAVVYRRITAYVSRTSLFERGNNMSTEEKV